MKGIEEIRRENLIAEAKRVGGDAALARKIGVDKNQVYQWLRAPAGKQRRNLKGDRARKIEPLLDRPTGWLDVDRSGEVPLSAAIEESRPKNNVRALRIAMQSLGTVLAERMPDVAAAVAEDIVEVAGTEFASRHFLGTLVGILRGVPQTLEAAPDVAPQSPVSSRSRRARAG